MFLVLLGFLLALRFDLSLAQGLDVKKQNDLSFGIVIAGTDKTVLPTDASAAEFKVTAPNGSFVELRFELPSSLNGPGGAQLTIYFGNNSAGWAHKPQGQQTLFDPSIPQVIQVTESNNLYVWVGGTVSPPMDQQAGDYSGLLRITVTLK